MSDRGALWRLGAWVGRLCPPAGRLLDRVQSRDGLRASAWNLSSQAVTQSVRLGSVLVMTAIIGGPEAFGLVALVTAFRVGLEMLSDVGIWPSIIQSPRGDDPKFLNTAWTLATIRGFLLWGIAALLAWPLARFYGEAALGPLLAVGAAQVAIQGMNCTVLATRTRNLQLGAVTLLGIGNQLCSVGIMIGLALWMKHTPGMERHIVWALVIGPLFGQVLHTIGTHLLDRSFRNRFHFDRVSAGQIVRFGLWVFVSTVLAYLGMQLDRLLLGRLMSASDLGVYNTAAQLGTVIPGVVASLGPTVMFPLLARVARASPSEIREKLYWVRLKVLVPAAAGCAYVATFGMPLVEVLFPPRFFGAGWILPIIAVGATASMVTLTYTSCLLAMGRSRQMVYIQASTVVLMLVGGLVGHALAGKLGFVVGMALVEWVNYPWVAYRTWRNGIWTPRADALVFGIALVGAMGAWAMATWVG